MVWWQVCEMSETSQGHTGPKSGRLSWVNVQSRQPIGAQMGHLQVCVCGLYTNWDPARHEPRQVSCTSVGPRPEA